MNREELINIYSKVKEDLDRKYYEYCGEEIDFPDHDKMVENTRRFKTFGQTEPDDRKYEDFPRTVIYVENKDFVDKALEWANDPDMAILNPASPSRAGGGVRNGSRALEEILCRRSNLLSSLAKFSASDTGLYFSKLGNLELIWSPGVSIYRDSNYNTIKKPGKVNVITAAALVHPSLNLDLTFEKTQETAMKKKIRMVLRMAIKAGVTKLLLPAWGCGAFGCPAKEVSRCFSEVFGEQEFQGAFEEICFAILDDHNAHHEFNPEGNYKPFRDVFGGKPLSMK